MGRDRTGRARIATLAGGVGAARFLRGLARCVEQRLLDVIVNTADDEEFYGLHVSPDLDTITYTLADLANPQTGWGLKGDTFTTLKALARFYGPPWFNLGDRDLATHIFRTDQLRRGLKLSEVTAKIVQRFGVQARIMPMTDDPVRTFVKVAGKPPMPFQEFLVKNRARGVIERIEIRGADKATPHQAAIKALEQAAAVIVAPSNPIVSVGPILKLRGIREVLAAKRERVAAISPLVGDRPVKGPLDKMMRALGYEVSALGVARLYRDFVSVFVIDKVDSHYQQSILRLGLRPVVADAIIDSPARAKRLANAVLAALDVV